LILSCSVSGKMIDLAPPWDAILIPVSKFPIPIEELPGITNVVEVITRKLTGAPNMSGEIFVQVEQSDDPAFRTVYSQHAREWIPEVGLGVWPDREPPISWTQEEFKHLLPGQKPRTLMHQVLWVSAGPEVKIQAARAMLPFGPLLQIMVTGPGETFLQKATSILLPPITDRTFTCYPFYVPLLEVRSLARATSEQLEAWLCGASLYIRESFEDNGILIVSRDPLRPILEGLGAQLEPGAEAVWRISR
jgi:hypothetical protein